MYYQLLFRRFLPLISSAALAVCFWFSFQYLGWAWFGLFVLIILAITILAFWCIVGPKFNSLWPFLVLIILFNVGVLFFSIFLSRIVSQWLLFGLAVLLFGIFMESLYRWLRRPRLYQIYSLENLSSFLSLGIFFWFTSTLYGFNVFLGVPLWMASSAVILLVIFLSFQFFWASQVARQQTVWYILVLALVVLQLFWSLSYLPVIFHVSSLILVVIWYVAISIIRAHLLDKLTPLFVKSYLIGGTALVVLTLGLANWR